MKHERSKNLKLGLILAAITCGLYAGFSEASVTFGDFYGSNISSEPNLVDSKKETKIDIRHVLGIRAEIFIGFSNEEKDVIRKFFGDVKKDDSPLTSEDYDRFKELLEEKKLSREEEVDLYQFLSYEDMIRKWNIFAKEKEDEYVSNYIKFYKGESSEEELFGYEAINSCLRMLRDYFKKENSDEYFRNLIMEASEFGKKEISFDVIDKAIKLNSENRIKDSSDNLRYCYGSINIYLNLFKEILRMKGELNQNSPYVSTTAIFDGYYRERIDIRHILGTRARIFLECSDKEKNVIRKIFDSTEIKDGILTKECKDQLKELADKEKLSEEEKDNVHGFLSFESMVRKCYFEGKEQGKPVDDYIKFYKGESSEEELFGYNALNSYLEMYREYIKKENSAEYFKDLIKKSGGYEEKEFSFDVIDKAINLNEKNKKEAIKEDIAGNWVYCYGSITNYFILLKEILKMKGMSDINMSDINISDTNISDTNTSDTNISDTDVINERYDEPNQGVFKTITSPIAYLLAKRAYFFIYSSNKTKAFLRDFFSKVNEDGASFSDEDHNQFIDLVHKKLPADDQTDALHFFACEDGIRKNHFSDAKFGNLPDYIDFYKGKSSENELFGYGRLNLYLDFLRNLIKDSGNYKYFRKLMKKSGCSKKGFGVAAVEKAIRLNSDNQEKDEADNIHYDYVDFYFRLLKKVLKMKNKNNGDQKSTIFSWSPKRAGCFASESEEFRNVLREFFGKVRKNGSPFTDKDYDRFTKLVCEKLSSREQGAALYFLSVEDSIRRSYIERKNLGESVDGIKFYTGRSSEDEVFGYEALKMNIDTIKTEIENTDDNEYFEWLLKESGCSEDENNKSAILKAMDLNRNFLRESKEYHFYGCMENYFEILLRMAELSNEANNAKFSNETNENIKFSNKANKNAKSSNKANKNAKFSNEANESGNNLNKKVSVFDKEELRSLSDEQKSVYLQMRREDCWMYLTPKQQNFVKEQIKKYGVDFSVKAKHMKVKWAEKNNDEGFSASDLIYINSFIVADADLQEFSKEHDLDDVKFLFEDGVDNENELFGRKENIEKYVEVLHDIISKDEKQKQLFDEVIAEAAKLNEGYRQVNLMNVLFLYKEKHPSEYDYSYAKFYFGWLHLLERVRENNKFSYLKYIKKLKKTRSDLYDSRVSARAKAQLRRKLANFNGDPDKFYNYESWNTNDDILPEDRAAIVPYIFHERILYYLEKTFGVPGPDTKFIIDAGVTDEEIIADNGLSDSLSDSLSQQNDSNVTEDEADETVKSKKSKSEKSFKKKFTKNKVSKKQKSKKRLKNEDEKFDFVIEFMSKKRKENIVDQTAYLSFNPAFVFENIDDNEDDDIKYFTNVAVQIVDEDTDEFYRLNNSASEHPVQLIPSERAASVRLLSLKDKEDLDNDYVTNNFKFEDGHTYRIEFYRQTDLPENNEEAKSIFAPENCIKTGYATAIDIKASDDETEKESSSLKWISDKINYGEGRKKSDILAYWGGYEDYLKEKADNSEQEVSNGASLNG